MKDQEKRFSSTIICGHCENKAPMEIVRQYSQVEQHEVLDSGFVWDEGYVYEILECPACHGIVLRRYYWHDAMEPDDATIEILFPNRDDIPVGMPENIEREYKAALKVKTASPNAYGVILGRLLELVCEDRKAEGSKLSNKLRNLSEKGEIPEKLVDMAENLHQLRHVGAHASLGELTPSEIPILDKLSKAILEYVYSAPHYVKDAENHLKRLRRAEKQKKK